MKKLTILVLVGVLSATSAWAGTSSYCATLARYAKSVMMIRQSGGTLQEVLKKVMEADLSAETRDHLTQIIEVAWSPSLEPLPVELHEQFAEDYADIVFEQCIFNW